MVIAWINQICTRIKLFNELGSKEEYEKEYGKTPVIQLVRKILWLDRNADNEAFSEFLNNQSFNSSQIHFVKLIVHYIVKNGFIEDNKILTEDQLRSVGSIIDLFAKKCCGKSEAYKNYKWNNRKCIIVW